MLLTGQLWKKGGGLVVLDVNASGVENTTIGWNTNTRPNPIPAKHY